MINKDKWDKLERAMIDEGIFEKDLEEQFILGSGSGGQKINTTHNSVRLLHVPTGLAVRYGKDRLRESNRFFARRKLLRKYLEEIVQKESERKKEESRIRKQKMCRSRKVKAKMRTDKLHRSKTKDQRSKSDEDSM